MLKNNGSSPENSPKLTESLRDTNPSLLGPLGHIKKQNFSAEGQNSSSTSNRNKMKTIDFKEFDNRFMGYVCIEKDTIYIPAIFAKTPNKGHFTDLINNLKKRFKEIRFTAVCSTKLALITAKMDFKPEKVYVDYYHEDTLNMVWKSPINEMIK